MGARACLALVGVVLGLAPPSDPDDSRRHWVSGGAIAAAAATAGSGNGDLC
jgi:hypothetical protein